MQASKYWQYASEKARTRKKNQEAGKKEANQEETKAPKTSACPSIHQT
jgi:hypothetical protein